MDMGKCYTTIGDVFDFLVEKHGKVQKNLSFPEAVDGLRSEGRLYGEAPEAPPFYSDMDADAFWAYIRRLRIPAEPVLESLRSYQTDNTIEEHTLFLPGKDVFAFLNMPYMSEVLHCHNFFEITYVLRGSCTFLFGGETATLSQGDVCIVSPLSRHSLPLEPDCLALSIVVRKSTFNSLFSNLLTQKDLVSLFFRNSLYEPRRANYIMLKTGSDGQCYYTAQQLVHECNLVEEYANACSISLLNLFLARALRAASAQVTLYRYDGYSQRDFDFALVLQYIQQNFRTVTLSSLADTFHFSQTYLSKLIHKNLNQSFTATLRDLKMSRALDFLMNTSMKVSEIADAVGYDSVDHFSRTFRKVYGVPPQAYKKEHAG